MVSVTNGQNRAGSTVLFGNRYVDGAPDTLSDHVRKAGLTSGNSWKARDGMLQGSLLTQCGTIIPRNVSRNSVIQNVFYFHAVVRYTFRVKLITVALPRPTSSRK